MKSDVTYHLPGKTTHARRTTLDQKQILCLNLMVTTHKSAQGGHCKAPRRLEQKACRHMFIIDQPDDTGILLATAIPLMPETQKPPLRVVFACKLTLALFYTTR